MQALHRAGLADVYRLLQFPVVVGTGKRLFPDGSTPATFATVDENSRVLPGGVVSLTLHPTGLGVMFGSSECLSMFCPRRIAWRKREYWPLVTSVRSIRNGRISTRCLGPCGSPSPMPRQETPPGTTTRNSSSYPTPSARARPAAASTAGQSSGWISSRNSS